MLRIAMGFHLPGLAHHAGIPAELAYSAFRVTSILGLPAPPSVRIRPKQVSHPLNVRLGQASDLIVFGQIFRLEEYASLRHVAAECVLDLGANVGYSSAYFLNCFPRAVVVAVEPDPRNFAICRQNLAPYGARARLVLGAVWSRRGKLALSQGTFRDGREWATEVREADDPAGATVEGWDVPSLMRMAGFAQIDLLKIDIEGSEVNLFASNTDAWLPCVRNLCIELHGQECGDALERALAGYAYHRSEAGELTILRNIRRVS